LRVPGSSGIWRVDGRTVDPSSPQLPLSDPGLLAGVGLFETFAVRGGRALDLEAHLDRMAGGASRLGVALPERQELGQEVGCTAAALGRRGWLKLVVTAAGRVVVLGDRIDDGEGTAPASAVLLPWRRSLHDPLAGLKTLSCAANLLGRAEAARRGADEGLWLNARGHLAEGSASNLFVVSGGRLCTAGERDGILPGVVRAVVLTAAARLSIPTRVGKLRLERLERAREAFLTSSLVGVRPLVRFEGRAIGSGAPGPLTRRLAVEVARLRESDTEDGSGRHEAPGATRIGGREA
jgi:branched-subunit amino acid aminotransferase/4-amino-4-deoxychorismate lyase